MILLGPHFPGTDSGGSAACCARMRECGPGGSVLPVAPPTGPAHPSVTHPAAVGRPLNQH